MAAATLRAGVAVVGVSQAATQDCADCPDMVKVPAGTFFMGADTGEAGRPEGPARQVVIPKPFAMGRFEVTNAQYAAFVAATGYAAPGPCRTLLQGAFATSSAHDWKDPGLGRPPQPDEPVVCVSWRDASAYAAWLSKRTGRAYRLPTEAEWEYGARAGSAEAYPWGRDLEPACHHANLYDAAAASLTLGWDPLACSDGEKLLSTVGRYRANAFGLHDMIGNVWEWTQDCYIAPYPASPTDGRAVEAEGACDRRTVRGAAWMTRGDRGRSSFRGRDPETARFSYFGFRVAQDLEASR
ncbi:MAG: formylglycine-generating enzyme family protein [Phenylobacterium sp.]|nr:formylglycine-generating enzyme family protein [Phenylobacterium sp.]